LPSLTQMPLGWRLALSPSLACIAGDDRICQNQIIRFSLKLQIVL
jgi:hypothetical protein